MKESKTSLWAGIGLLAGVIIGSVADNVGLGIALGLCFGAGIGTTLEKKSNKNFKFLILLLLTACSKNENTISDINNGNDNNDDDQVELVYPNGDLNKYSSINKKTSWYRTNNSFTQLYDVRTGKYFGFEKDENGNINLFVQGTWNQQKENCCYYWHDLGQYLYTDLNNDGNKDLWAYYYKAPWPTNERGIHLFVDNIDAGGQFEIEYGLTQVRKTVLSDFNNDGKNEITLFSHGYDKPPFPGDSLAIFDVENKKYKYLSDDIGFFHGGATGDVNNDGHEDILTFGDNLVFYLNNGSGDFTLNNNIFLNFTDADNYYTVELFDIDNDGLLDLFLGSGGTLLVVKNENGTFNRINGINIQTDNNLEVMDINFFDFDNDNIKEILVMNNISGYQGHSLNLYKFSFENNSHITSTYFDDTKYTGNNAWIKWLHIFDYDKDGDLDIVGNGLFGEIDDKKIHWENENGKFKRRITN